MKSVIRTVLVLFCMLAFNQMYAQDEPKAPKDPKPKSWVIPDTDFDFEFDEFGVLKLSEKEEQELLKNIRVDLRKELDVIKNSNKNKYFQLLRESQFKYQRFPFMAKREKRMLEREKKIFESEIMTEALATKYENANESEKRKIKNDLRNELNTLFEQKEERRKEEVQELEKELIELQKSLAVRQKNKKEIIDRRLQELLDEDQYLDWD